MASDDLDRVVPLGQMDDFTVAEGDPDVRGWEVLASDGRKIGEVDELLVDARAMKVRYLDVDVDVEADDGAGADRHVLIPVGYARLDRERDRVLVDALASAELAAIPAYDQGPLTRDYETSVRDSFRGGSASPADAPAGAAAAEDPFYAGDAFDDRRFYDSRRSTGLEAGTLDDDWKTRRVGQVGDL
jgi:sporulation protein YlmC with PRC-barrel domain